MRGSHVHVAHRRQNSFNSQYQTFENIIYRVTERHKCNPNHKTLHITMLWRVADNHRGLHRSGFLPSCACRCPQIIRNVSEWCIRSEKQINRGKQKNLLSVSDMAKTSADWRDERSVPHSWTRTSSTERGHLHQWPKTR